MIDCVSGKILYKNLRRLRKSIVRKSEEEKLDARMYPYATAMGSLTYLIICMRETLILQ